MATAFIDSTISEQATSPWTGFETGLWQTEITFGTSFNRTTSPTTGMSLFLRLPPSGPKGYGVS